RRMRTIGAPNGVIAHAADGQFDLDALRAMARDWPGLEGMDLARTVSTATDYDWQGGVWRLGFGYEDDPSPLPVREGAGVGARPAGSRSTSPERASLRSAPTPSPSLAREGSKRPHVVAVDY